MSCRVLGRQVEPTTLNLIAAMAQLLGARRLIGEYIPTAKNGMVKDHYLQAGGAGPSGKRRFWIFRRRATRDQTGKKKNYPRNNVNSLETNNKVTFQTLIVSKT